MTVHPSILQPNYLTRLFALLPQMQVTFTTLIQRADASLPKKKNASCSELSLTIVEIVPYHHHLIVISNS